VFLKVEKTKRLFSPSKYGNINRWRQ